MGKKTFLIMSILVALSLILSACATPTPETVIKTVVVEREGETVIETVEVIKTVEVEVTPTPVPREARASGSGSSTQGGDSDRRDTDWKGRIPQQL